MAVTGDSDEILSCCRQFFFAPPLTTQSHVILNLGNNQNLGNKGQNKYANSLAKNREKERFRPLENFGVLNGRSLMASVRNTRGGRTWRCDCIPKLPRNRQ